MDKWRWIRISLVLATLGGLHLPCAAVLAGQLSNASCYGDGQMSVYWSSHTLTGDAEYYNVTVTGTLNTNGYTLRVRGALTNYGTITDLSGAAGGSGGTGATGGHVGTYPTYHEPCCCTPGESGNPASCAGGGHGGSGGGGGGGGGGSEHRIAGDCWQNGGATGGNGGNGGAGGRGGGCVTIYAYNLNNQGIITADGGDGQAGSNGTEGDLRTYYCSLAWRDASGGGGGGGGGGNGGDAGSVKVYYAHLVERGEISAHGGAGGNGGTKGGSRCAELQHNPAPAQVFHYGSPGCTSGDGECGSGGAGGESDCGTSCGPTAHGYDGSNGCPGENGAVLVIQDCNCNGVADQIDIAFGTSEDCQPNGIPDECELDSFHVISSQLSPVGVGSPQSYTLCHPPEALGTVALIFRASADLAESDEYIDVDLDGMAVGRIFEGGAHESDCPAGSDGDWLSVSRATFNAARAGGGIVINLTASAAVDPDQCTPSWIDVVVTYEADNDQDADGVPDPCSIAWFSAREIDLFQDTFDTTTCAHNALCQNQELPKMVLATEESLNVHVLAPGGLASPSSWVRL
ncbi:MAG: hypothetical protein KJ749_14050, partial [Planctomycetes bacterium]|nr:hypothetical protein [Planctomycetota bacterium]